MGLPASIINHVRAKPWGEFPLYLSYGHRIDPCGASVIRREITRPWGELPGSRVLAIANNSRMTIQNPQRDSAGLVMVKMSHGVDNSFGACGQLPQDSRTFGMA